MKLLPSLRRYNPRIEEALLRTARIAVDDLDFIQGEAEKAGKGIITEREGVLTLDKAAFTALHPALQRHLLRAAVESLLGSLKDIESGHIEDMLDALERPTGKAVSLPGGLVFTVEYDRFLLGQDSAALCPYPPLHGETHLNISGRTVLQGWEVEARVIDAGEFKEDRFQPLGMSENKKLNHFMIDSKIPRSWRSRIPIIVSPERVVWVVGCRIDDRARVTESTHKILSLSFIRS